MSLLCPLCSAAVATSSLEAHLRRELDYAPLSCRVCQRTFLDDASAQAHVRGPLRAHPGREARLLEERQAAVEARLAGLLRSAGVARGPGCGACDCCARWANAASQSQPHGSQEPCQSAPLAGQGAWEGKGRGYVAEESQLLQQSSMALPPMPSDASYALRDSELVFSQLQEPDQRPETSAQGRAPEQRQAEAPEPPAPLIAQVKAEAGEAEAEDVKPGLRRTSDGLVTCLLCGLRVGRDAFKRHALGAHSKLQPFSCGLCNFKKTAKKELVLHVRKLHPESAYEDVVTELDLAQEAQRLMESCFGSTRDLAYASLRCTLCDKTVPKTNAKSHAALYHLKKAIRSCRLCDFVSKDFFATQMKTHLKKWHGEALRAETCADDAAKHLPALKRLMADLFEQ